MLSTDPQVLAEAIKIVKPARSSKSVIDALQGVRLTANPDEQALYLTTTNLEVAVERRILAHVTEPIDVVLDLARVEKAVKMLSKKGVDIQVEDAGAPTRDVKLSAGTRSITVTGSVLEDFPAVSFETGETILTANGKVLHETVQRAYSFASKDETRPHLTAMLIDLEGEPLLVSTDSYRLGLIRLDAEVHARPPIRTSVNAETANEPGLLIMGKPLTLAAKSLAKENEVSIHRQDDGAIVVATCDGERWRISPQEGRFPNYRQLIPDDFPVVSYFSTLGLAEVADACVQMQGRNAPMRVKLGESETEVSISVPDQGSFTETIPCNTKFEANIEGQEVEPFEIGLNPEFLRDITKHLSREERIKVQFISPLRPCFLTNGPDRALLMPIRLNV